MESLFDSGWKADEHSLHSEVVGSQVCVVDSHSKLRVAVDHIKYLEEIKLLLEFSVCEMQTHSGTRSSHCEFNGQQTVTFTLIYCAY